MLGFSPLLSAYSMVWRMCSDLPHSASSFVSTFFNCCSSSSLSPSPPDNFPTKMLSVSSSLPSSSLSPLPPPPPPPPPCYVFLSLLPFSFSFPHPPTHKIAPQIVYFSVEEAMSRGKCHISFKDHLVVVEWVSTSPLAISPRGSPSL